MTALIRRLNSLLYQIPHDIVTLALRIFPAMVFFQSGRAKVGGLFTFKDSTWFFLSMNMACRLFRPSWRPFWGPPPSMCCRSC